MKKILFLFIVNFLVVNRLFAQTDVVTDVPQQMPSSVNTTPEYTKFLYGNLKYPNSALRSNIEGTVYVKFIVDKDGSIMKDCVKVERSVHPILDAEAIRVVKMFPNQALTLQNGIPTQKLVRMPVRFVIAR